MNKKAIYDYLKELGVKEISSNNYLVKDLRLSSKEIIDFAIFIKINFGVKINLSKDMKLSEIFESMENGTE